jgi:hypothetical protein
MDVLRSAYRRFDEWARGLSRVRYALLGGALTGLVVLALTVILGDVLVVDAAMMAVGMAVAFYWANPNRA